MSTLNDNKTSYVPIFIIVHDRITVLKKTVKSFEEQIKTPIKIVFHDVASTYKPCLEYLKEMKSKGYDVYRSNANNHHSVMNSVKSYLKSHPECKYYVVTDPDIELDNVNGDILEFYMHLSDKHPNLSIGPMLRIDDIPDYYPKKKIVVNSHVRQFWHKKPAKVNYNDNKYDIQFSAIDTTFQLMRANVLPNRFPRGGIRCYAPYSAKHLDWYLDPKKLSADQIYYSNHASPIAHWGRKITNKK